MTAHEAIAAIRAEIERRLEELNPKQGEFAGRPLRAVNLKTLPRERELEKMLGFLDTLEAEQPSLLEGLEEAVERMASDIAPDYPDISWDTCYEKIEEGIKAGAEWMAGQGETFETEISNIGMLSLPELNIQAGDKVTVQIRKKA